MVLVLPRSIWAFMNQAIWWEGVPQRRDPFDFLHTFLIPIFESLRLAPCHKMQPDGATETSNQWQQNNEDRYTRGQKQINVFKKGEAQQPPPIETSQGNQYRNPQGNSKSVWHIGCSKVKARFSQKILTTHWTLGWHIRDLLQTVCLWWSENFALFASGALCMKHSAKPRLSSFGHHFKSCIDTKRL